MRMLFACFALVVLCSTNRAQSDDEQAKKQLTSDNFTVTWGTPPVYEADAELEIGDGNGHGGTLSWIRFQPGKDGVDVISVRFDEGWHPYESKWPPDRAPVAVKRARLKPDLYAALLRDLAIVDAAKLKPVQRNSFRSSSNDFWVYARLTTSKKTFIDLNWAGYEGSLHEVDFAKPRAAVRLAQEAVKGLDFKDHTLTDGERAWTSAKFVRDWNKFKGLEFHWWVRERYIETIGVVGDKSALSVLREILTTDPPKDKPRNALDGRCIYRAINAVTRLTKTDVRDKPVEEMDIEKTRLKVVDLIKAPGVKPKRYIQVQGVWETNGFRITAVKPGGPATKMTNGATTWCLEPGDVIVEVEGTKIESQVDYTNAVNGAANPDKIEIKVWDCRWGKVYTWYVGSKSGPFDD